MCILASLSDSPTITARDLLHSLIASGWYALSELSLKKTRLKAGDRICFNISGLGIVADATIANDPKGASIEGFDYPRERFNMSCNLASLSIYDESPTAFNIQTRNLLSGFIGRDIENWGWYVRGVRRISSQDFDVLTRAARTNPLP